MSPTLPTERDVVANGLRHHLLEWDGGGDATVLCLHGFLDMGWGFATVAPAIAAAGYHVVAPDLRGHGDTEWIGRGGYYHFLDYLLDVADLVDRVARRDLHVVGHSMGGSIGALLAGTFPDRPRSLVVMEGMRLPERPDENLPHRALDWIHGVRRARARGPRTFRDLDACAARIREYDPLCPPDVARFLAGRGTRRVEGGLAFKHDPLHATRGPYPFRADQFMQYWRAVRCPVLLVEGERTEMPPPPDAAARAACFRDVRAVRIPRAGHMMMRHEPEAVTAALLAFLRSV